MNEQRSEKPVYKVVETLATLTDEVNGRPIAATLDLQCRVRDDGKDGVAYPLIKIKIDKRETFYYVDVADKVAQFLMELLPQARSEDQKYRERVEELKKKREARREQDKKDWEEAIARGGRADRSGRKSPAGVNGRTERDRKKTRNHRPEEGRK